MRGGYGSSEHATLGERAGVRDQGDAAPVRTSLVDRSDSPARHCLVDGAPSLLVEWRQGERGWEGRVLSVVWLEDVGWGCIERWLPASAITPA